MFLAFFLSKHFYPALIKLNLTVCRRVSAKNTWSAVTTEGALVQGGYGHSSVFDPSSRAIYIHGGYKAFSANKYGLAGDLYKFEVDKRKW